MSLRDILDFLQIDDDTIRFFIYGGTGAIVNGVRDEKRKTFWQFLALAFVGAATSAFVTPAVIVRLGVDNIKYQMFLGFIIGIGSMVLITKILKFLASKKVGDIEVKEGEENV